MKVDPAQTVMKRIEALGRISDDRGRLTRTFCSSAMRRANDLTAGWMRRAGMEVREDAIGNLIGHYASHGSRIGNQMPGSKLLLIGSHLDTVRDAGKFDGPLGVLVGIACVDRLRQHRRRLPFGIEVIGFADEEGVRYQSTYLGSKALAGTLNPRDLKRVDSAGIPMAEAIDAFGGDSEALASARIDSRRLIGYVEVHIEQGPVLEHSNLAVGVVSGIAGQSRAQLRFLGQAGHAGTTPMKLRRDALCAAAEFVLEVENLAWSRAGLAATVGELSVPSGATNVIPGEVRLSLDVRHAHDRAREAALKTLQRRAAAIARKRSARVEWHLAHEAKAIACDLRLSSLMGRAVGQFQDRQLSLASGAGHDAAAMAAITPIAMLFVRCKGGVSHHPDESVNVADVLAAIAVLGEFLDLLAHES